MLNQQILVMLICLALKAPIFAEVYPHKIKNLPKEQAEFYEISKLQAQDLEQNLYAWGLGISSPKENYYEIGQALAHANYQLGIRMQLDELSTWQAKQKAKRIYDYLSEDEQLLKFINPFIQINGKKRINMCNRYDDQGCIQETIGNYDQISALNRDNAVLQKRYEAIPQNVKQSIGYIHPYSYPIAAFPDIGTILSLLDLDLANAVIDLSNGQKMRGIERLERISFFANLSHSGTLTLPSMQLNIQQALNQTINGLLDEKLLDPNDEVLERLYELDIDRFDQKFRDALKWQAKYMMQNNLFLYQDYKENLMEIKADDVISLEDDLIIAGLFYKRYKAYEAALDEMTLEPNSFHQVTLHVENLPFNITLTSPYEYLMQAKYQKAYEKLLRAKIKILKGESFEEDDEIKRDQEKSRLYIEFKEKAEEGAPTLPQSMRWFNKDRRFLERLEVDIP